MDSILNKLLNIFKDYGYNPVHGFNEKMGLYEIVVNEDNNEDSTFIHVYPHKGYFNENSRLYCTMELPCLINYDNEDEDYEDTISFYNDNHEEFYKELINWLESEKQKI